MPGDIIGEPTDVVRDGSGRILYQDYEEDDAPATEAKYCCDGCGRTFVVEPVIQYKVRKEDEALDFSEIRVSLLD